MFMFSCRFETKMRQNAPNPISISIFFRGNPRTPATRALPPDLLGGEESEGREGERAERGEGEGKRKEGREGEGKVCVIAVGGDRRP